MSWLVWSNDVKIEIIPSSKKYIYSDDESKLNEFIEKLSESILQCENENCRPNPGSCRKKEIKCNFTFDGKNINIERIGHGNFGFVYKITNSEGISYISKFQECNEEFENELKSFKLITSKTNLPPNFPSLYAHVITPNTCIIYMSLASGPTLSKQIEYCITNMEFNEAKYNLISLYQQSIITIYMYNVILGLNHCDCHLSNFLINSNDNIKCIKYKLPIGEYNINIFDNRVIQLIDFGGASSRKGNEGGFKPNTVNNCKYILGDIWKFITDFFNEITIVKNNFYHKLNYETKGNNKLKMNKLEENKKIIKNFELKILFEEKRKKVTEGTTYNGIIKELLNFQDIPKCSETSNIYDLSV